MGGVDHNDHLRQYYHIRLKCRKYYKYLYRMLFDITISNTYILSSTSTSLSTVTRSTKDFRSSLAKELLQGYCSRKTKGRHPVIPRKQFQSDHFPLKGDGKQHPCHLVSGRTQHGCAGNVICISATEDILTQIVSCYTIKNIVRYVR